MTKDTYLFDPETNHFFLLDSQPEMDPRTGHAVAYVEQTDLLYLYGGYNFYVQTFLNDLWMMSTTVQGKQQNLLKLILYLLKNANFH